VVTGHVLLAALVATFRLRLRLPLRLSSQTILEVLPGHRSKTSSIIPLMASTCGR